MTTTKTEIVNITGIQTTSKALITKHTGNKAEYQKDTKKAKT